jgi:hypothetical protein
MPLPRPPIERRVVKPYQVTLCHMAGSANHDAV